MELTFANEKEAYEEVRFHLNSLAETHFRGYQFRKQQIWYGNDDSPTVDQYFESQLKLYDCAKIALELSYAYLLAAFGTRTDEPEYVQDYERLKTVLIEQQQ